MPQVVSTVENNFTRGLITEATGLNFPENASTDTQNCIFTLIGDVIRRQGINEEVNGTIFNYDRHSKAMSQYVWNTAGGTGTQRISVLQIGSNVYFFLIYAATITKPLSVQQSEFTLDLTQYTLPGTTFDITQECQYASGNGYLFIFNSNIDPVFVNFTGSSFSSNSISIKIRDFIGVTDTVPVNFRPQALIPEHQYNIQNQGWTDGGSGWSAGSSTSNTPTTGSKAWTIGTVTGISNGQSVAITGYGIGLNVVGTGTVTSYTGGVLTLNVTSISSYGGGVVGSSISNWTFQYVNIGHISAWASAESNYPSNADVWWYFKDTTGAFNPGTTVNNVTLSVGNAPQGHYILPAFNIDRSSVAGISGLTPVVTLTRPTTGAWFQGRVWYSGVDAAQPAGGDAKFYSWSSNIYFSQIVEASDDFGLCFQNNDPTSETLSDLLPTDGGVITIPETGNIYKLWPIQNGMLIFADNGVWFITGNQGIGFAANDYTITKISAIKTISGTSFVDVLGLPFFWNEEGIYQVIPSQSGSLTVMPITVGTILTYFNQIPISSKKYARGDYDPIGYTIQWAFRSTQETSVLDRYNFDTILNFNTYNKAFFPYVINTNPNTSNYVHGVQFVTYPYVSTATPLPGFKYITSSLSRNPQLAYNITFADEHDTTYVDWGGINYISYFVTGYKVHGDGQRRFQIPYLHVFSRNNGAYTAYYLQSIWNYAISSDSGNWGIKQFSENQDLTRSVVVKRHRLRGRGLAAQFKISSVDGQPFDVIGWSIYEAQNQGV